MNNKKGFTIIELIVVIAVIAVLAAIVVSNIIQYEAKSKLSAAAIEFKQLQTSASQYYSDNNNYSNFCNSSKVQNIANFLKNMYPNGKLVCQDNAGTYTAYNDNGLISIAKAAQFFGPCPSSNQYMVNFIYNGTNFNSASGICANTDANGVQNLINGTINPNFNTCICQ